MSNSPILTLDESNEQFESVVEMNNSDQDPEDELTPTDVSSGVNQNRQLSVEQITFEYQFVFGFEVIHQLIEFFDFLNGQYRLLK